MVMSMNNSSVPSSYFFMYMRVLALFSVLLFIYGALFSHGSIHAEVPGRAFSLFIVH